MKNILQVKSLSFRYPDGDKLFTGIDFSMDRGQVLGVIGPSGCGKSTLALALSGIIPHSIEGMMEGTVLLLGKDTRQLTLPQIATRTGIVFQDPDTQLFLPCIRHELAFGPENLCRPREEIARVIQEVAAMTSIEELFKRNPNEISGGQRQLAALSAVLCLDPDLLILDEVFSQLDEDSCRCIMEIIRLLKEKGKAMIIIDHNHTRLGLADRILAMGESGMLALGSRTDILEDQTLLENCFGKGYGKAAS